MQLAASDTPVIAYVSCNPASFARDAKLLVDGGYTLDWVQPVGQFRWSTHVELAGRFSEIDRRPRLRGGDAIVSMQHKPHERMHAQREQREAGQREHAQSAT